MTTQKLIGLAGKAGSGKDTIAYYIEDVYGYWGYAFADPIKFGLTEILGLDEDQLWGGQKELEIDSVGKSPRQLMQSLGDWGKSIDPDFWLKLADRSLSRWEAGPYRGHTGVVITDVRYENEAAFVRDRGGVIIHIDRPDAPAVHDHDSERGVSGNARTDICIRNDGTINDLHRKVADVMDRFSSRVVA